MHVVLFAATGQAGKAILAELASRGHTVTAVARDPSKLGSELSELVTTVKAELNDVEQLADLMVEADAVISAFGPSTTDPRHATDQGYTDQLVEVTARLIAATEKAKAPRLIVVGGAGSLFFSPGVTVLDSGHWPVPYAAIARSHVKAFAALRTSNVNWTYFSPPMDIFPGERTGKFRLGMDDVIRDEKGENRVSFEDYAVALVDELEQPRHERSRFTIAY